MHVEHNIEYIVTFRMCRQCSQHRWFYSNSVVHGGRTNKYEKGCRGKKKPVN